MKSVTHLRRWRYRTAQTALAFDSAADPTYNAGWRIGSNGGSGWGGPWRFAASDGGTWWHIASSTLNGNGDPDNNGDINEPRSAAGRAWTIATPPNQGRGHLASASRPLKGALLPGQGIQFDFDNSLPIGDPISPEFAEQAFRIESEMPGTIKSPFQLRSSVDFPDYVIRDALGERRTGVPLTDQGLHCVFELVGPTSYSLTITPLAGDVTTRAFTGALEPIPINMITAWSVAGGPSFTYALFVNNLAVVPKANSLGLAAASCAAMALRRRCHAA